LCYRGAWSFGGLGRRSRHSLTTGHTTILAWHVLLLSNMRHGIAKSWTWRSTWELHAWMHILRLAIVVRRRGIVLAIVTLVVRAQVRRVTRVRLLVHWLAVNNLRLLLHGRSGHSRTTSLSVRRVWHRSHWYLTLELLRHRSAARIRHAVILSWRTHMLWISRCETSTATIGGKASTHVGHGWVAHVTMCRL